MKLALRCLILVALVGLTLAAPPAAFAEGGTYTQWVCRLPDGSPAPTQGFKRSYGTGGTEETNTCASGGSMHLAIPNPQPGWFAYGETWLFSPPEGLTIAGGTVRRSVSGM